MPRGRRIDTTDQQIGQPVPRDLPSTGDPHLDPPQIEPVEGPEWEDKADLLKFMEEDVTIIIHPSADRNAEKFIQVYNSGRLQMIQRGVAQKIKRKYVEVLARAKTTNYRQEEYIDADGIRQIRNIPLIGLRYPFSVIEDRNPDGVAWLQKVLAEA